MSGNNPETEIGTEGSGSRQERLVSGRGWPWQCWVIWYFAIAAGVLEQIAKTGGNVYLAAILVMGFCHYLRRAH